MTVENEPSRDTLRLERAALRQSAFVCLGMAVVGIVFAVFANSEAIMLDGLFNAVSFVAVLLSARLVMLIHSPGTDTFPFGYAHMEPIVNTLRATLLLTISGFALFSAVRSLLAGGSGLNPGGAVYYAVIIGVGCLTMAVIQKRRAVRTRSGST